MCVVPLIRSLCGCFGCSSEELLGYLEYSKDRSFLYHIKGAELYVVGSNRRIDFCGLTVRSARRQPYLPLRDTTVEEIYRRHGRLLQFPNLPSVTTVVNGKTEFYPLETLYTVVKSK